MIYMNKLFSLCDDQHLILSTNNFGCKPPPPGPVAPHQARRMQNCAHKTVLRMTLGSKHEHQDSQSGVARTLCPVSSPKKHSTEYEVTQAEHFGLAQDISPRLFSTTFHFSTNTYPITRACNGQSRIFYFHRIKEKKKSFRKLIELWDNQRFHERSLFTRCPDPRLGKRPLSKYQL